MKTPPHIAELGRLVEAFHGPPAGLERRENGYWYAHCSCGYVSARRGTERNAAEALIVHMIKVGEQLKRDGVSLPGTVIGAR